MITLYSNIISVTTLPNPLLDDYPNAAAAYSLRLLRTAYTGSAIRVRRADNNAEQDIGFVNNELDTSTLTSFCSGTDGFVTKWYDQSGNANDATQITLANQPQIVSSGSVLTLNNKPRLSFNSKSLNFIGFGSSNFSVISVIKAISISNFSSYIHNVGNSYDGFKIASRLGGTWQSMFLKYSGTLESLSNSRRNNVNSINGNQYLENWIYPNNPALLYENNNSKIVSTETGSGWGDLTQSAIGSLHFYTGLSGNFDIQEIVIYSSNQSLNLLGINTNINTFYSIY